jgi:heparin binding hemagglutinin HbhA
MITMAGSLPTSADVRRVREQTAKTAGAARTPLLAVLGAGDVAVTSVTRAVATARTRAAERREAVQQRATDMGGLRDKLTVEELRKLVETYLASLRAHAGQTYAGLADRGEQAWDRIRTQPQVQHAFATIESYTEKLDARVDDAHDAAEKALSAVTRQTRLAGDRVARVTHRAAGRAAGAVDEASTGAGKAVAEAGSKSAEAITEAGDEAAASTRSTAREAAAKAEPKAASGRSSVRRTAAADATTESDS